MPTQPGLDGYVGVVELAGELHAEPFHDSARFEIADGGERHELSEAEVLKAERNGGSCSLRGVAQPPIGFGKASAYFHTGREWKLVGWDMQSNEANELARLSLFDRPEAPAALVDQLHDSLGKRVALLSRPRRRVVAHDLSVRIHRRERGKV
jgi:hypothetical protein